MEVVAMGGGCWREDRQLPVARFRYVADAVVYYELSRDFIYSRGICGHFLMKDKRVSPYLMIFSVLWAM